MRLAAIVTALLLAALPAQADPLQDDADALDSCMVTAWPRNVLALCPGTVSAPCQAESGGETTLGMNQCLAREADAWDAVLSRQWPRLMTRAREVDAANSDGAGRMDHRWFVCTGSPKTSVGNVVSADHRSSARRRSSVANLHRLFANGK